jgi:LEA14-like dessication related protein
MICRTLLVLSIFAVTGCQSVVRAAFASPVVALRDVQIGGFGITGGTINVVLSVYNPNEFNLDASSITYSVVVDSTVLGAGQSEQRVIIPARDSAIVRLPVQFGWDAVSGAGQKLLNTGSLKYQVKGEMKVASGVGTVTIPYDQAGYFSGLGRP